jgi:NAD(P)-dependent dehydrogenase (short-subunit alcohol dehydrogenase family)
VLVNNVGGFWAHRHVTADGLERTFALNHLASFLLTNLLLDRLTASAPARIVTVSSGAQARGRIDVDDLQGERNYSGQRAYSQSKLANVMFTYELARRLEGTGVTATVLHPGVVRTSFGAEDQAAHFAFVIRAARPFMKPQPKARSPRSTSPPHLRSRALPASTSPTASPRPPPRPPAIPLPRPAYGRSAPTSPAWPQPHSAPTPTCSSRLGT